MNGRCCIGNNNDVSLFISAFSSVFFSTTTTAAAASNSKFCGHVMRFFLLHFLAFANWYCFEFFIIWSHVRSEKPGMRTQIRTLCMRFGFFPRNLLIYFVCVKMNELKMCASAQGRRRASKKNWHHQSSAGFRFKSIIINVFVFAHIHFISDILFYFFFLMCASVRC